MAQYGVRMCPTAWACMHLHVQMEEAYKIANDAAIASGKSRGHFMVDIAR